MDFLNTKWFYILIVACFIAFYIIGRDFRSSVIPMIKAGFIESAVLKTGIAVNADIIAAHQTSMWNGNKPIYHLTLKFKTLNYLYLKPKRANNELYLSTLFVNCYCIGCI